jgi:hypothetical protein
VTIPVTARLVSVPTEVSDEAVTVAAIVDPLSVPAAAVTVIFPVPSKLTPLIVRAVRSFVAVAALPTTSPVRVPRHIPGDVARQIPDALKAPRELIGEDDIRRDIP